MRRERVAGWTGSRAGTRMCALITARVPASMAARNGTSSRDSRTGSSASMRGIAWCESTAVSPCPGKCLVQAATPADCSPETYAAVCRATSEVSAPKDRTPITGLSTLELMSADGAQLRFTPQAASRRPSSWATASVSAVSSTAPSAWLPGKEDPVRTSSRVTSPPSSSMATRTSSRSARNWAVRAATWAGVAMFRPNRPTEARPSPSRRSSQEGAEVPVKPGCRTARASRVSVSVPEAMVVIGGVIPSPRRRSVR